MGWIVLDSKLGDSYHITRLPMANTTRATKFNGTEEYSHHLKCALIVIFFQRLHIDWS